MRGSDGNQTKTGTGQRRNEEHNVTAVLSIQCYAGDNDAEGLESVLQNVSLPNMKTTLDGALIDAIKKARVSSGYLDCVKILHRYGADLNTQDDSTF